jgi:hypothetical protein
MFVLLLAKIGFFIKLIVDSLVPVFQSCEILRNSSSTPFPGYCEGSIVLGKLTDQPVTYIQ